MDSVKYLCDLILNFRFVDMIQKKQLGDDFSEIVLVV
jgi:hypothetical protein